MVDTLTNLAPVGNHDTGDASIGIRYPKDYNLIAINMLSAGLPSMDLKATMVEISYFEDLYSNVVTGQLMVTDAMGIIEKMGMHGNEYIRLAFGKDDNPNIKIDKLFRVYKISSRQKTTGFDSEVYTIHFCSDEFMLSEQYKISKSYDEKKISFIINDILKTYLKVPSSKKIIIEETQGIHNFIIPNFKPFEAINWLATYAQPQDHGSVGADMMFFENKEGFVFASLQSLFNKKPYFSYEYRPKNIPISEYQGQTAKEVFNILAYEITNSFNTTHGISNGMFANRLLTMDPLLRRYEKTDFDYTKYHSSSTTLNDSPIINNLQNRFGHALNETSESCYKLSFTNKNQKKVDYIASKPKAVVNDMFVETFLSQRKAQLSLANYTRMKFYIGGDPNVSVGMTINFNMLTQEPGTLEDPKSPDKLYSGKYLVTAVRHMIQSGGYSTIIEAIKDSLPNSLANVNNGEPIWRNTVAGNYS